MIYLLFAVCIFSLDLFFKKQIETKEDTTFPIHLKGGITLEKHHNHGFIFNRLDQHPKLVRVVSCLTALPLIIWVFWLFTKKDTAITDSPPVAGPIGKLGAAFLLGGAASNLYDRLSRGYVVDYLRFRCRALPRGLKKIRNIIFNIADFFIFAGGLLTTVYHFFIK